MSSTKTGLGRKEEGVQTLCADPYRKSVARLGNQDLCCPHVKFVALQTDMLPPAPWKPHSQKDDSCQSDRAPLCYLWKRELAPHLRECRCSLQGAAGGFGVGTRQLQIEVQDEAPSRQLPPVPPALRAAGVHAGGRECSEQRAAKRAQDLERVVSNRDLEPVLPRL